MSQASAIISKIEQVVESITSKETRELALKAGTEKMDEIKNRETRRGKSPAKGGQWRNTYNREYAKRNKSGRRSPVNLRDDQRDIEKTTIKVNGDKGVLSFTDTEKGRIFNLHDKGEARGGKVRQIYPRNQNELPDDVVASIFNTINREIRRNG